MRLLILQGHPDGSARHFGHALADAYAEGARAAGHDVHGLDVAGLDFPLLRSRAEWESSPVPRDIARARDEIRAARHLALFFPLWMGDMPALFKGFLEQVARPGFAIPGPAAPRGTRPMLAGRSARLVVTMGMPAVVYRWWFRSSGLRAVERGLLGLAGIAPVHDSVVGSVESTSDVRRARWLHEMAELGARGA